LKLGSYSKGGSNSKFNTPNSVEGGGSDGSENGSGYSINDSDDITDGSDDINTDAGRSYRDNYGLPLSKYGIQRPSLSWCHPGSALVCSKTEAWSDPFRSLFYTTNPTLYNTQFWLSHFGSYAAVLGDARAIEETITVSHPWRVSPGFTSAFSPGLFRHKRMDRAVLPRGWDEEVINEPDTIPLEVDSNNSKTRKELDDFVWAREWGEPENQEEGDESDAEELKDEAAG
jgi:hypothetical protein